MVEEGNVYSRDEIEDTLAGVEGCPIIGTLDDSLIAGYVEIVNIELDIDNEVQALRKRLHIMLTDALFENRADAASVIAGHGGFDNEAEAEALFEKIARYDDLSTSFWYNLRCTFTGHWNNYLSIRKGFRVIDGGKKFTKR